ncbi:GrpB family protein [Bacillus thuringiensis]|uniref:GrpB family protein n=1 Tax=Bacillus thuringiensis TaxID=1428 RepID=A0AAW9GGH0_BACTU|nr:GrpB family protein [Bacillus thuringiensis]
MNFLEQSKINEMANKEFSNQKSRILELLPNVDIQHIGSTAIPNSITKGDLDIQVRVSKEDFTKAVEILSTIYDINEGSTKTDFFRAFKDDLLPLPLGVQLTVINSDLDIFWKIRDVLLKNDEFRKEYDDLKRNFEGKTMDEYRLAKNQFFERIMNTPEYNGYHKEH